ncbi:MAG: NAD(P)-dependent oxidoreductase [Candidatus Lokiarchaeota archaeon]
MKAFITANLKEESIKELEKHMEVTYENWVETGIVYFDINELIKKLEDFDIFITEADDLKKKEIFESTNLKLIAFCRGDPFNIDLKTATENNIPVINTPLRNVDAVAELTICYILMLARKVYKMDRILHSDEFEIIEFEDYLKYYELFRGIELLGKKVGIIGFGQVGRRVAERLKAFGTKILIYDPYVEDEEVEKYGKRVELKLLMRESDFITIHAKSTDDNDHMVNKDLIKMMKKSAFLINLAKGSLVDYQALHDALIKKEVGGAALDVFPLEPIDEDNEFLELDNVIVSPHIGGSTKEVIERQSNMIVSNILSWLKGEIPENVLNPEVFDKKIQNKTLYGKYDQLKKDIVDLCKKLLRDGHVVGSAGNVSIRIKKNGEQMVLITPSNVNYEEMVPEDILIIDMQGNVVEGNRNPSVEKHMHLGVYKKRPDVNAIIHAHSVYSTILSTLNLTVPPIFEELVPYLGGEVECATYGEAGSGDLAKNVVEGLGEKNALLLANHGNLCCGSHLEGAYTVLTYLERGAKIYYLAKLHKDPNLLPEDTIEYEQEIFELFKESKKI